MLNFYRSIQQVSNQNYIGYMTYLEESVHHRFMLLRLSTVSNLFSTSNHNNILTFIGAMFCQITLLQGNYTRIFFSYLCNTLILSFNIQISVSFLQGNR